MTATAADALLLLSPSTPDTWPAGITAAADLRQARAEAATPGPYVARSIAETVQMAHQIHAGPAGCVWLYIGDDAEAQADAEHIAAEASPTHALAAIRHWRGTVERHRPPTGTRAAGSGRTASAPSPSGPLPPIPDEWYPPDAVPLCTDETWLPGQCVHGVGPDDDCGRHHEPAPGPTATTTTGRPGAHQDADGAVEAPADRGAERSATVGVHPGEWPGAAPSVQTPDGEAGDRMKGIVWD